MKKDKKPTSGGGFLLPPPGSSGGRLAPPPADKGGHPVAFIMKPPGQSAAPAAASVFDFGFGSSDPFAQSLSTAPSPAPTTDAFGFPISTIQPKSNAPPNLLDF